MMENTGSGWRDSHGATQEKVTALLQTEAKEKGGQEEKLESRTESKQTADFE